MPALGAAITSAVGAFQATATGAFLTKSVFGRLLLATAISGLQVALTPKPKAAGIVTETTLAGSTVPMKFIVGLYATAGQLICPPMSHGRAGKTPNAYRTYVVALSCIRGAALSRLIINGEYVTLGTASHADYGLPVQGKFAGHAWVKYYDGTQTSADPHLLGTYGSLSDRPWTSSMIGRDLCYAILTFKYNAAIWTSGEPSWRFEMLGVPFYDPRSDSSVGGSGTQRWSSLSTWSRTTNPMVIAYNIMRGVTISGLGIWGGEIGAEDLPLAHWFAAMTACDQAVTIPGGGSEARYRAGYEIDLSMQPASVLEELFKASSSQISEVGGVFKPRTGGPGLPAFVITDDDLIITEPQELDPFPPSNDRYNGVAASYPAPEALWETRPAPDLLNLAWETEDGGRRRVAALQLPACPFALQVQRLMSGYARDDRRFLRHTLTLPPDAAVLEPLDTLMWSSERNGYTAKLFELGEVHDDVLTLSQTVALREVDPTDYPTPPGFGVLQPSITGAIALPDAQGVPAWAVAPYILYDAENNARRAAIRISWDAEAAEDARGLRWWVRLAGQTDTYLTGVYSDISAGTALITTGVFANQTYEVSAELLVDRASLRSAWLIVTLPDVLLRQEDLALEVWAAIDEAATSAAAAAGIMAVTSFPATGSVDQIVLKKPEMTLHRWTGSNWVADIVGNVGDASITAAKLAAGSVTANALAAGSVIASKLAAGAVTADKMSVASLSAISANLGSIQVGAANILDASISALKVQDLAIGTQKIEDFAVSNSGGVEVVSYSIPSASYTTVASFSFNTLGGKPLLIQLTYDLTMPNVNSEHDPRSVDLAIRRAGTIVKEWTHPAAVGRFIGNTRIDLSTTLGTSTSVELLARRSSGGSGTPTLTGVTMAAVEYKK